MTQIPSYVHTQTSALPLALMSLAGLTVIATLRIVGEPLTAWHLAPIALVTLGWLVFGRLTITIDAQTLYWSFGWLRWPRWQLPLAEITELQKVRTRACDGWGVRKTTLGMLYNIAGFDAVRLRCRDGRTLMLGTNDAERLAAFIAARLTRPRQR